MLADHYKHVTTAHANVQQQSLAVATLVFAALTLMYYKAKSRGHTLFLLTVVLLLLCKANYIYHHPVRVQQIATDDSREDVVELTAGPSGGIMNSQWVGPVSLHTAAVMFPHVIWTACTSSLRSHEVSQAWATREMIANAGGRIRVRTIGSSSPMQGGSFPQPSVVVIEHLRMERGRNFMEILSSFGLAARAQDQMFVFGSKKMFAHRIMDNVYHGFAMPRDGYDSAQQRDLQHQCLKYLAQNKTVCFYPLGWSNSSGYKVGAFLIAIAAGVPLVLQSWDYDHDGVLRLTMLPVSPRYTSAEGGSSNSKDNADMWALESFVWPAPHDPKLETYRAYRGRVKENATVLAQLSFNWVRQTCGSVHMLM